MSRMIPLFLLVLVGCQGAPLGEKTSIPVTEIQNRSADIIATLQSGDLNKDGKIEGAKEQWAMLNALGTYLVKVATELINGEE